MNIVGMVLDENVSVCKKVVSMSNSFGAILGTIFVFMPYQCNSIIPPASIILYTCIIILS